MYVLDAISTKKYSACVRTVNPLMNHGMCNRAMLFAWYFVGVIDLGIRR